MQKQKPTYQSHPMYLSNDYSVLAALRCLQTPTRSSNIFIGSHHLVCKVNSLLSGKKQRKRTGNHEILFMTSDNHSRELCITPILTKATLVSLNTVVNEFRFSGGPSAPFRSRSVAGFRKRKKCTERTVN